MPRHPKQHFPTMPIAKARGCQTPPIIYLWNGRGIMVVTEMQSVLDHQIDPHMHAQCDTTPVPPPNRLEMPKHANVQTRNISPMILHVTENLEPQETFGQHLCWKQ